MEAAGDEEKGRSVLTLMPVGDSRYKYYLIVHICLYFRFFIICFIYNINM